MPRVPFLGSFPVTLQFVLPNQRYTHDSAADMNGLAVGRPDEDRFAAAPV
jgi:hypothetical protein